MQEDLDFFGSDSSLSEPSDSPKQPIEQVNEPYIEIEIRDAPKSDPKCKGDLQKSSTLS